MILIIIRENFESDVLILGTERDDLRIYNDVVTEVWVVVSFILKKALSLRDIIRRKKIFDSRLFKLCFLVFLFSPIIASIELAFFI